MAVLDLMVSVSYVVHHQTAKSMFAEVWDTPVTSMHMGWEASVYACSYWVKVDSSVGPALSHFKHSDTWAFPLFNILLMLSLPPSLSLHPSLLVSLPPSLSLLCIDPRGSNRIRKRTTIKLYPNNPNPLSCLFFLPSLHRVPEYWAQGLARFAQTLYVL